MEARDIANITYELIRVRLDRCCMEYEDQLSRLAKANHTLRRKYEYVKKSLVQQKDDYLELVERVKAFTAANSAGNSSGKASSSSSVSSGTGGSAIGKKSDTGKRDRGSSSNIPGDDQTVQKAIEDVMHQSHKNVNTTTNRRATISGAIQQTIPQQPIDLTSPPPRNTHSKAQEQSKQQHQRVQSPVRSHIAQNTAKANFLASPVPVAHDQDGVSGSARKRRRQSIEAEQPQIKKTGDNDTPLKDIHQEEELKGSVLDAWLEADPSLPLIQPTTILPLVPKSKDDIAVFPSKSITNSKHIDDQRDDIGPSSSTASKSNKSIITGNPKTIKRSMTTNMIGSSSGSSTSNSGNNTAISLANGPPELLLVKKGNSSSSIKSATTTAPATAITTTVPPVTAAPPVTTNSRVITANKKQPSMISWVRETEHLPHYNKDTDTRGAIGIDVTNAARYQPKYIEVVRNRDQRSVLPGHACEECDKFYQAMQQQGIVNDSNRQQFMQSCSRHKSKFTPPSTPEGFWDLSIRTPADWK